MCLSVLGTCFPPQIQLVRMFLLWCICSLHLPTFILLVYIQFVLCICLFFDYFFIEFFVHCSSVGSSAVSVSVLGCFLTYKISANACVL